MGSKITNRERGVLLPALLFGWSVEFDRSGYAKWEGDTTLPFRAHKTLDGLIAKGLMERVPCNAVRATWTARDYVCRARGCQRGSIYAEGDDGHDHVIAKCKVCDGTGITLVPIALIAAAHSDTGEGREGGV